MEVSLLRVEQEGEGSGNKMKLFFLKINFWQLLKEQKLLCASTFL